MRLRRVWTAPAWQRRRFARRLLHVAIGPAIRYLFVVVNTLLRTRLLRALLDVGPEALRVEYASAYSLLPGRIHVEGLTIRGKDHNVEWLLSLDRCDFTTTLRDLFRRRFHADHVRGDGVALRARLLESTGAARSRRGAPRHSGFSDPPLKEIGPARSPAGRRRLRLWSVELDDVDANHVQEVWVDALRYSGDLRIRGRWFFRPLRWLEVGPAIVDVQRLDVAYGSRPLLLGLEGTLGVTVHPFDVRVPNGREVLKFVSLTTSLLGFARTAEVFDTFVHAEGVHFRRGDGPIRLDVVVDHGAVAEGTRLEVEAREGVADLRGWDIRAGVRAELDVQSARGVPSARIGLHATRGIGRTATATLGAEEIEATLMSPHLDLSRPDAIAQGPLDVDAVFKQIEGGAGPAKVEAPSLAVRGSGLMLGDDPAGELSVDLPSVRVPDLAVVARSLGLPRGLRVEEGTLLLGGHADLDLETMEGRGIAEIRTRALHLEVGSIHVTGALNVKVQAKIHEGKVDLSGSTSAFEGLVANAQPWWARASTSDTELRFLGGLQLRSRLQVRAKDGSLILGVIAANTDAPAWLLNAIPTNDLEADGELRLTPSMLEVRSLAARAGASAVRLEYADLEQPAWAMLVDVGPLRAGVGRAAGHAQIVLSGAEDWFNARVLELKARERAAPAEAGCHSTERTDG